MRNNDIQYANCVDISKIAYHLIGMDTKTALLDSAESAVRRRGYDGFSYADLAKDVGIRKASIHYHFPKKEDLALALIERYGTSFFEILEKISNTNDAASVQLEQYLNVYRNALSGCDTLCLCVSFSISGENLSKAVLEEIRNTRESNINWLKVLFEKGRLDSSILHITDPAAEAAACLAMVEGAQIMARVSGKIAHFDRSLEQIKSRMN